MIDLFHLKKSCQLIGMVHLQPLPGSPQWAGNMKNLTQTALHDAHNLIKGGCDAIIVENMGDVPYVKNNIAPETFAAMTLVVEKIVQLGIPTGIQILAAANEQALSMAYVSGAAFIRVEGFAYAHVADEGWIDACAGMLLRKRSQLRAAVSIWSDVQKKHASHSVTADLSLGDIAQGNKFCGADALVVTGKETGKSTNPENVKEAKKSGLPVIVGSGVTPNDAPLLAQHANGLIVGSWLKKDGDWRNRVDVSRVKTLASILRK